MLRWLGGGSTWSLHNPLKDWTLHGLTDREAALIVATLSQAERHSVVGWRSGLTGWVPLQNRSCSALTKAIASPVPADLPQLPKNLGEEETTAVRSLNKSKLIVDREHVRIDMRLPVEVICGGQTFSAETDNVSEGGIKFAETLPDWVAGYFTVVLKSPDGDYELTCMLVEDQKRDKMRVAVVETADEESHLPRFKQWVRALIHSTQD